MITLRESHFDELVAFAAMEKQLHARKFVNATALETHQKNFLNEKITYLSIEKSSGQLAGYFILVNEPELNSIEFRRVLIDKTHTGIGQAAIMQMEQYCIKNLQPTRIWLDVYDDNAVGRHIYEKLGYQKFKTEVRGKRLLHFYDKSL